MIRPLAGRCVLVTRPRSQSDDFGSKLEQLGAEVLYVPAIKVREASDTRPLDAALKALHTFDWLVFTSVNGVEATSKRIRVLDLDPNLLARCKIAVVGPATAAAVEATGGRVSAMPQQHVGKAIADELGNIKGSRILLARADRASKDLPQELAARGADVTDAVAYEVVDYEEAREFSGQAPDVLTFTSPSSATATLRRLREKNHTDWLSAMIVSIGPVTTAAICNEGYEAITADPHTTDGMIQAILLNLHND